MLTGDSSWPSSNCIPAQKIVSESTKINHNRSTLVLGSGNGVCCHHSSLYDEGVTVGHYRMNSLLFADELVLHAWIFSTGSSTRI